MRPASALRRRRWRRSVQTARLCVAAECARWASNADATLRTKNSAPSLMESRSSIMVTAPSAMRLSIRGRSTIADRADRDLCSRPAHRSAACRRDDRPEIVFRDLKCPDANSAVGRLKPSGTGPAVNSPTTCFAASCHGSGPLTMQRTLMKVLITRARTSASRSSFKFERVHYSEIIDVRGGAGPHV